MSDRHVIPARTNYTVFGALMALLVATVVVAYIPLPHQYRAFHLVSAMTIATIKAVLIVLYFMHVRYSSKLTWLFASAAFFWLAILLVFCLSDYGSRNWLAIPGK
jgi:cytochrome c oxidase subunit 4